MKKATLLGVLFTILFANKLVFATSSYDLDGSNPIVLIHGILGFDDRNGLLNGMVKYWGYMDTDLRKEFPNNSTTAYCSKVLTPGTSAAAHTSTRAVDTALVVNQWMAACGYTKVNLIGHSQGGLVARWMAKNVSTIRAKIKVVTTLNSVHQGTPTADFILGLVTGLPTWVSDLLTTVINKTFSLIYKDQNGDGRIDTQDVMTMGQSLTVSYMRNTFNATACTNNTSTDGVSGNVRYYSYGSKMKCPILGNLCDDLYHHPIMGLTFPVTAYLGNTSKYYNMGFRADNDGIVPLYSQKWGTWKGEPDTYWSNNFTLTSGVDHLQATKMKLFGVVNGDFDELGRMLDMAVNAKNNQNF
jgi:triacylglycerol lipase